MVTGSPEVKLTPYIGAVVLKVDLHNLAGVISLSGTQVLGLSTSGVSVVVVVELSSARNENHSLTVREPTSKPPTNFGTLEQLANICTLTKYPQESVLKYEKHAQVQKCKIFFP